MKIKNTLGKTMTAPLLWQTAEYRGGEDRVSAKKLPLCKDLYSRLLLISAKAEGCCFAWVPTLLS